MEYAAADVRYLLALQDRLDVKLAELGRSTWAAEACEELRTRPTGEIEPDDAWTKLKDARTLRPRSRSVAQAVAAWREREAQRSTSRCVRCSPTSGCSASPSVSRRRSRSSASAAASTSVTRGRSARN